MKKENRSLIIRNRVNEYLLLTIISFAASVSLTRLFLELTGYPQLGGGKYHIAHVLWGGLLLFIGALLPLIFANRLILDISAILSGIGIGLFIDEVGKFITQSNDYFYPSAAPIIYAFFLLTVLLYVRLKRPREKTSRIYMYHAFRELEELLDNDLSIKEKRKIMQYLSKAIETNQDEQLTQLAITLQNYLKRRELILPTHKPTFWETTRFQLKRFESKWISKQRLRLIISIILIVWGLYSMIEPWTLFRILDNPQAFEVILENLISRRIINSAVGLNWFQAKIGLKGALGLVGIFSGILILVRRERAGVNIGIATMLIMISLVNLILFYFDQFSTIIDAIFQLIILLVLIRYRTRFLPKDELLENEPEELPSDKEVI